ncbi:MAG: hypothetical protein AAF550_07390, partial [Myxococcota bacterium]
LLLGMHATAGCSRPVLSHGVVVYPAAVPARAFPLIVVLLGEGSEATALSRSLAEHLSEGGESEVRLMSADELSSARQQGLLHPSTVVLAAELRVREHSRPTWTTMPETVCGPVGCFTERRTRLQDLPEVLGSVTILVTDGATAEELQRVTIRAQQEGRDGYSMRRRVLEELDRDARTLFDPKTLRVEVPLLEVDHPDMSAAIEAIRGGNWKEGRLCLERQISEDSFASLSHPDQARVLYTLAQARRFDPSPAQVKLRFDAAEAAVTAAIRLDPRSEYAEALEELRRHRMQVETLEAQRAAAAHNFSIVPGAERPTGVPTPPPGYR